jgi:hypothetical protein
MAVTAEQLGAFNSAIASGDYAGAAAMAQGAGFSASQVADYVNANLGGLGLSGPVSAGQVGSFYSGGGGGGAAAPQLTGQALIDATLRAAAGGSTATRQSDIQNIITATVQNGGTERDIAINLARANIGLSEVSQLLGRSPSELAGISGGIYRVGQERPISQMLPPPPLTPGTGQSNIDPLIAPYLQEALERSRSLFLGAPPSFFPGQTYVPPSAQTQEALNQMEMVARGSAPYFEQAREAFGTSLRGQERTAGGAFLGGSPYREQMIEAATRPLTQQFQEQVLPGISSQYSAAGRYGSGSMERAQERATEGFTRAMGDVTSAITAQDYGRERAFQEASLRDIGTTALQVPDFYSGFLRPAQTMAAVGGQREAIAAQPLQESMQRFQFAQQQPYQQLGGYLSSIYGSPLASSGMVPETSQNRGLQNVGTALSFLGALPGPSGAVQGAREGWDFVSTLLR